MQEKSLFWSEFLQNMEKISNLMVILNIKKTITNEGNRYETEKQHDLSKLIHYKIKMKCTKTAKILR